jgi:exosortase
MAVVEGTRDPAVAAGIGHEAAIRTIWVATAAAVALLIWTYWLVLPELVTQWWNEDEYSHGFLVPLISIGLVWHKRAQLRAVPIAPAYTGVVLMAASLAVYATGIIGADLFLQRVSMVSMVAGATLYITGWRMFAAVMFPIAFLLFMVPLPGIIFNSIAFPLQLLAAQIATDVMQAFGIPVFREGNIMHLASTSLDVEEACSGIRSLISLSALGVLFAYVTESRWLPRLLIAAMIVPIAVVANVFRVTVTGLLAHYVSVDAALGVFHTVGGLSVFLLATVLLLAFAKALKVARISR